MPLAIKINPKDNVVVALHPIAKGTAVPVDGASVTAVEDIPQGHKMAIAPIHAGENVIKYGFPIGHATADAQPGTWMHTHNVHTNLSGEVEYSYNPAPDLVADDVDFFDVSGIELLQESAVRQRFDSIVVCPESPGEKNADDGERDVPDEPLVSLGAVIVHVSPTQNKSH